MKTIFRCSPFLVLLLAISCSSNHTPDTKVKREGEPDISLVQSDDREMNKAIAESKRHFPDFIAALQDDDSLNYNFAVKVPFNEPDGGREHIWLIDISIKGDSLYGIVNNEPYETKEVIYGQMVAFSPDQITDWNYIRNGKLVGGYTIRVLRNKMTAEEKKELDASLGVEIE